MPPKKKPSLVASVEVFQDGNGEYRWTAKAANGEKIATSGEGYVNRSWAKRMAKDLYPDARISVA